jgi:5S rRNA maturation endonuclease (ribonuclease M5)
MNALELADKLEGYGVVYVKFEYRKQASTMLRQQQAEIEALKAEALKAEVKQWEEWKKSLNGWSKK